MRDTLAIVLWWVLILCIGFGIWPLARVTRAAWVTGGLLALFGLWTLLSAIWAANAAGAFSEFTRVMLYLAVFAITVAVSRRANAGRWLDGLALGIVAVAVVALVSRFFPGTFEESQIPRLLPAGTTRLAVPLGYWNGLAVLVGLGIPLLLRAAVVARTIVARSAAVRRPSAIARSSISRPLASALSAPSLARSPSCCSRLAAGARWVRRLPELRVRP